MIVILKILMNKNFKINILENQDHINHNNTKKFVIVQVN